MRAYGYTPDHQVIESEAAIVREIAARLVLGEPVTGIVRNLNDRNITTAYGAPWNGSIIRQMMRNKRISGEPIRDGTIRVPAIISPELHARTREVLARPQRRIRMTEDHRNHIGTGWLRCGRCGKTMPSRASAPPVYFCDTRSPYKGCGRMRIGCAEVDDYLPVRVLARIARSDVRSAITDAAEAKHGGLERMRKLNDAIKEAIRDGAEHDSILRMESELEVLVKEYEPVVRWGRWFAARENVTPQQLARWWLLADTRRRQDLLAAILHHIDVRPMPYGGTATAKDRLAFVWLI